MKDTGDAQSASATQQRRGLHMTPSRFLSHPLATTLRGRDFTKDALKMSN